MTNGISKYFTPDILDTDKKPITPKTDIGKFFTPTVTKTDIDVSGKKDIGKYFQPDVEIDIGATFKVTPEQQQVGKELDIYFGKLLPERWAESPSPFKRGIGTSVMKMGKIGYLFAPLQMMIDVPIGIWEEVGRKVNYKKAAKLRTIYEAGEDFPDSTRMSQTLTYGEAKKISPEAGRDAKDKIRRGIYSPLAMEEPMGFTPSIMEAIGRAEWIGGMILRNIKDPTPGEQLAATTAGLFLELKTDPINYISFKKIFDLYPYMADRITKSKRLLGLFQNDIKETFKIKAVMDYVDDYKAGVKIIQSDLIQQYSPILKEIKSKAVRKNMLEFLQGQSENYFLQAAYPDLARRFDDVMNTSKAAWDVNLAKQLSKTDKTLIKAAHKIGFPELIDGITKSKVGRALKMFPNQSPDLAQYMQYLPRFRGAREEMILNEIAPTLGKIPAEYMDYAAAASFGKLDDYLRNVEKLPELKINQIKEAFDKIPELQKGVNKFMHLIYNIDDAHKIKYTELSNYMTTIIKDGTKGKKSYSLFQVSKPGEFFQEHKAYENLIEAIKAKGKENVVTNLADILRIRLNASLKLIDRNNLITSMTDLYGSKKAITGYEKVTTGLLGTNYYQPDVAKMLKHQEELINKGEIMDEILEQGNKLRQWWKKAVTIWSPSFHGVNYPGGKMMNYMNHGSEALSWNNTKRWLKVASDKMSPEEMNQVLVSDSGIKYPLWFVEWLTTSLGGGKGFVGTEISSIVESTQRVPLTEPFKKLGRVGEDLGAIIEGALRREDFWLTLKKKDDVFDSLMSVLGTHFDYSAVTPFERAYIKTKMPFEIFWKNIIPATIKRGLEEPGRLASITHMIQAMNENPYYVSWGGMGTTPELKVEKKSWEEQYMMRPEWYNEIAFVKLPFEFKGQMTYLEIPWLPTHFVDLVSQTQRALEKGLTAKERLAETVQYPTGLLYPDYVFILEKLMGREIFFNRPIRPDWAEGKKDYRVKCTDPIVAIVSPILPDKFKTLFGLEYQVIEGQKTLMIIPEWLHFFKKFNPMHYKVNAFFAIGKYMGYEEAQQYYDQFYTLTGLAKFRSMDEKFNIESRIKARQRRMDIEEEQKSQEFLEKLKWR